METRLPSDAVARLWNEVGAHLTDEPLGLKVARNTALGSFGLLEYLARTAPTFDDGLTVLAHYVQLNHDLVRCEHRHDDGSVTFQQSLLWQPRISSGHTTELLFGLIVIIGRQLTGIDWSPTRVEFRHRPQGDESVYRDVFGTKVRFGATIDSITFSAGVGKLPLTSADRRLHDLLQSTADQRLQLSTAPGPFVARVSELISQSVAQGRLLSLPELATCLQSTPRTLQRHLTNESTSFEKLLDSIRHGRAQRLLSDTSLSIAEIASALGFKESASFCRSFRRWTNETPRAYRQRVRGSFR